jgi:putative tricarboxylic transport membrane protein
VSPKALKGRILLVVPADSNIKTLDDFIALAKSKPGELLFGIETGGSSHIMAGLMSKAAGISIKYVEAGADTEKMSALVGGSIEACLVNPNQAKQYVEAVRLPLSPLSQPILPAAAAACFPMSHPSLSRR